MLKGFQLGINAAVQRIATDARQICGEWDEIIDEDDFTSQFVRKIKDSLNNENLHGLQFKARVSRLKWRGARSQERVLGADLFLSVDVKARNYAACKGYFVQAKASNVSKYDPDFKFDDHLRRQVRRMLAVTPESYVWIYAPDGVSVLRAGAVGAAGSAGRLKDSLPFTISGFFRSCFSSRSGDFRLGSKGKYGMQLEIEKLRATRILEIVATGEDI
ncbi:hypothetical protein [Salinarimonas chemoclinalis]|uniref:hypothetical protein n=1 Tax=Salinarimonas chemoclinalis TaxID=3241599 RepID=UPI003557B3AA